MKTQISHLITGQKEVRRNLSHSKYLTAKQATSHTGFAGTNRMEREEVAAQIIKENFDFMTCNIAGVEVSLKASRSLSGKTVTYCSELTEEQYELITGHKALYSNQVSFSIQINMDMTITVFKHTRKSNDAQWKIGTFDHIGEEFVTIL